MGRLLLRRCARILGVALGLFEVLPRRLEFLVLYYLSVHRLGLVEPLVVHIFDRFRGWMPISGIGYGTTKSPGYETLPNGGRGPICWESPIAITLYSDSKPVLGLGIEIVGKTLYIRQMQGVKGVTFEGNTARHWPRLLLEAAKEFAKLHGLRRVRVRRAHESLFFKRPEYPRDVEREARPSWKAEHQRRMRRRYDGTARQAGFVEKEKYYEWVNENARSS